MRIASILVVFLVFSACRQEEDPPLECPMNSVQTSQGCICFQGFSGDFCEIEDVCESGSLDCADYPCIEGSCVCPPMREGDRCEAWMKDVLLNGFFVDGYSESAEFFPYWVAEYRKQENLEGYGWILLAEKPVGDAFDSALTTIEFDKHSSIENHGITISTITHGIQFSEHTAYDFHVYSYEYETSGGFITIRFKGTVNRYFRQDEWWPYSSEPDDSGFLRFDVRVALPAAS